MLTNAQYNCLMLSNAQYNNCLMLTNAQYCQMLTISCPLVRSVELAPVALILTT